MPISASAAVPLMFEPVRMGENLYVDGGITNNFPIEPLLENCNFIIGSHVGQWPDTTTRWTKTAVIQRSFQLAISSNLGEKMRKCDVLIDPPIGHFQAFNKSKNKTLMEIGYAETMRWKEKLETLKS